MDPMSQVEFEDLFTSSSSLCEKLIARVRCEQRRLAGFVPASPRARAIYAECRRHFDCPTDRELNDNAIVVRLTYVTAEEKTADLHEIGVALQIFAIERGDNGRITVNTDEDLGVRIAINWSAVD